MSHPIKISLWAAVFININIIIGAAFFANISDVTQGAGILSPLAWLACGLVLLPLTIIFAKLANAYPSAGGLYVYSQRALGTLWGFVSGWSYFIGSVAFNTVIIHNFCTSLQSLPTLAPWLEKMHLNGLGLDIIVILLFAILNLLNVKFLENFQLGLVIFKAIPIIAVLIAAPFIFNVSHIDLHRFAMPDFVGTIPLVLFAYIGIEACCSIADKIENGTKNAARAIFISFALTIIVYTLLQTAILLIHGTSGNASFFEILPKLTSNTSIINGGNMIILLAILFSYLGGFYGMFYFNNWNIFAMAKENHIPWANNFIKRNKNHTPWVCVLFQTVITLIFLCFTQKQNSIAIMGDWGVMIAYLLSVISFIALYKKAIGYLALVSSLILIGLCTKDLLFSYGLKYSIPFLAIIASGIIIHIWHESKKQRQQLS
ncbi:MAG: hypothetical protein US69_C0012G0015 [candidate division TM6 bacterium GW2011_GWF2_38_10]|nr:MAG: hypothetical protein US69_C0012G0015 [candidate division TM6 bacterium GW2011_GWF2_38_10]